MATTIGDYLAGVKQVLAFLKDTPKIAQQVGIVAGKEVEAAMGRRIFLKGLDANNSAIGTYSTKPFYINPNSPVLLLLPKLRKRKPVIKVGGKTGETVFKNGKPHKTAYIAGGYAGFRQSVGREPGAKLQRLGNISASGVNLNLTGSMALNFTTGVSGTNVALGFTDSRQYQKAKDNEKLFGKTIFAASDKEKAIFAASIDREMNIIIRKILSR